MTQSQEIISTLIKEVQRRLKQEQRGLTTTIEAYEYSYGMIQITRKTLKIIEPETKFLALSQLESLVCDYYAGTKTQKELASEAILTAK